MKGIVFEGGGAAGYCHIGVLSYLENKHFDYYAGSSSGSIVAVLAAFGFSADNITEIAKKIKIPQVNFVRGCFNLVWNYGWLTTDFIAELIISQLGRNMSLEEFEKITGKKLVITACKDFKEEYFTSFGENKEVKVAEAVARSCAFPYVFARRNGYSDGGIIDNFPFSYLVNILGEENVLGVYLKHDKKKCDLVSKNIFEFTINLFNCLTDDHSTVILPNNLLKNVLVVNTTIKTFDLSEIEKGITEGYSAAKQFFEER